jgi:hypothetical protein
MNKIGNNPLANRHEYNGYVTFSSEDDMTFFHAILLDDIEDYQTFDQFEPNNILIGLFGVGVITSALLAAIKKII